MDFNRFYLASQDLAYAHPSPDFSVSLIPIYRPTPITAGKVYLALPESTLDFLRASPPPRSPRPPTGQHGMRGDCSWLFRGLRAISLRNDRSGRAAIYCGRLFPHFHASTRPIHQSIDPATKHGIFATNDAKSLKALRTLRPTLCELCGQHYLISGAMTLSEMMVLAMDEILLRTEISRMRKEGTRRGASERNRRGYGRDKRGPPA